MVEEFDMESSRLKRAVHQMPDDIALLLEREGLTDAYRKRPPYQQNDYIGWINRAKTQGTREKRIKQMAEELRNGNQYMKMEYRAR